MAADVFCLGLYSSFFCMTNQSNFRIPKHVILLVLFLAALWGGNTPAVKFGLLEFQPIAAAAIRFAMGIVIIIGWAVVKRIPLEPDPENYGRLLLLGTVFVAQIVSFNWGIKLTEVGRASLLFNTYPLFIALLAHFFIQHDRLTFVKAIGLTVAFIGVFCIFYSESGINLGTGYLGDLIILLSGFLLAVIHILLKLFMLRMHQFQLLFGQMVIGCSDGTFFFGNKSMRMLTPYKFGLASNDVHAIDGKNSFWIAGRSTDLKAGITYFDPSRNIFDHYYFEKIINYCYWNNNFKYIKNSFVLFLYSFERW